MRVQLNQEVSTSRTAVCSFHSDYRYSHTLFPTHVLRPSCSRRNHSLLQLYPYSYPITFSSPLTCLINLSQDGEKEGLKTPSTSGKVPKQYDMTRKSKLELGEGTLAQCFPKVLPQTDQPAPSIRAPDEEAETGSLMISFQCCNHINMFTERCRFNRLC